MSFTSFKKKPKMNMKRLLLIFAPLFLFMTLQAVGQQLYWQENGVDQTGPILTYLPKADPANQPGYTSGWVNSSGHVDAELETVFPPITLNGYPGSGQGVSFIKRLGNGTTNIAQNKEWFRRIGNTPATSTEPRTYYLSAIMSVESLRATNGAFNFTIGFSEITESIDPTNNPSGISSQWTAAVTIKKLTATNPSTDGQYEVGAYNKLLNSPATFESDNIFNESDAKTFKADGTPDGDTIVVILKYTMSDDNRDNSNDIVEVYASSTMPTEEPTLWDVTVDNAGYDWFPNAVFIRERFNGAYDHMVRFGNLRVADSWDDLFPSGTILVTDVGVNGENDETIVDDGGTLQMYTDVLPISATTISVTWSVTSGTGESSISETGLLTGVSAGTVTVVATANDGSGVTGTREITVRAPVLVSSIIISIPGGVASLTNFSYTQLSADVFPLDASDNSFTWTIQNGSGLATISDEGTLVAYKEGSVTVTATANDGSGISDQMSITVEPNLDEDLIYRQEAEFGSLRSGAALVFCTNGSNGQITKYSDVTSASSVHENVVVPSAGEYLLKLKYYAGATSFLNFSKDDFVNPENTVLLQFDNVGFCSVGPLASKEFLVTLNQGGNTLYFKNTGGTEAEPLLDIIEIYNAPQDQTITFDALSSVSFGDAAFGLTATASSGLAVTY
ncbi:MAG: hypothetical protein ACJA2C_002899, partial [Marinoscillum sp.]